MRRHLVFTLHGPLQAWGTVAVGEVRPVSGHPTRSGILGLLAAALGVRRDETSRLGALHEGYGVAVRVDAPGVRMLDYHTVQTPGQKSKREFYCRRDELVQKLEPFEELNTILSTREYVADACFTACVWAEEGAPWSVEQMRDALMRPRFTPYLGRKSCVAAPFVPQVIEADEAGAAFALYGYVPEVLSRVKARDSRDVFTDPGGVDGVPEQVFTVRDRMLAPATRRFDVRAEQLFRINQHGEG
ncbi:CRISPR system Cascade subunit CasD [Desulfobaculum xiamenense]|uniref:CRISPR system Cascade subunit CasD n=1 Tax=Desulfobaculum xiamenense TaxID=995050 RepID=A0A846QGH3_9BACT|nr:type I-E CRISPR-associated protein Cas5/CasD [Desulfobaculum xiamenense]NJB67906.1 CRISPR system Cascade subunit CasD [Desulfobaculum xiamenense]